ncbi:hypothetical protein SAMN05216420_101275 [Nitrosospira sp. Nl5]|uniref:hypothetical protein n=1 Tax=Nitrosospira sp. Nl5 TaxID=200120 RepID=UPI00088927A9|nr:hypothetical protein [Nitrosospira sp. Nl5]SCX90162.1 hypothetical protein SAMN05216420_101275 [Nitrosospira sp. Nl5]
MKRGVNTYSLLFFSICGVLRRSQAFPPVPRWYLFLVSVAINSATCIPVLFVLVILILLTSIEPARAGAAAMQTATAGPITKALCKFPETNFHYFYLELLCYLKLSNNHATLVVEILFI